MFDHVAAKHGVYGALVQARFEIMEPAAAPRARVGICAAWFTYTPHPPELASCRRPERAGISPRFGTTGNTQKRPENGFHGRRKAFPAPNFNGFRPVKSSTCEEGSGAQCDRRTVDRGQHVAKIERSRARPMGTFFFSNHPPPTIGTASRPKGRRPALIRRGTPRTPAP
jgi:hypothetical protein